MILNASLFGMRTRFFSYFTFKMPLMDYDVESYLLTQFFVSSHMYSENPEGTRVIVGSMKMDMYSTLPGLELATSFVPSARRFH